jgi:hypothetical protein
MNVPGEQERLPLNIAQWALEQEPPVTHGSVLTCSLLWFPLFPLLLAPHSVPWGNLAAELAPEQSWGQCHMVAFRIGSMVRWKGPCCHGW